MLARPPWMGRGAEGPMATMGRTRWARGAGTHRAGCRSGGRNLLAGLARTVCGKPKPFPVGNVTIPTCTCTITGNMLRARIWPTPPVCCAAWGGVASLPARSCQGPCVCTRTTKG